MDYWHFVEILFYDNIEEVFSKNPNGVFYFFSTKAAKNYAEVSYGAEDFLVFGKETKGLPEELLSKNYERCVRLPMIGDIRSLNLSNSVAIAVYEAWRQNGFCGGRSQGVLRGKKL